MAWKKGKPRAESTIKKMRKLDDEQRQEAIQLYQSGLSANKVAEQFGCGDEAIRQILIEEGIPRRNRSEAIKLGSATPESRQKRSESHKGKPKKPLSQETKDKISEARKREWKNPEYRAKQIENRRSITKKLWENEEYREKVLRGVAGYFDGKPTSIELKVMSVLESLGIMFEFQKVFDRAIVDFYIPNGKKIIEADGDYWHSIPEVKERDKRRDYFLKRKGYCILRLSETEINDNPLPKIKDFLNI